jgi:hypothetical protein
MGWAALSEDFHDDPRIVEVGLTATGLYACLVTYSSRHRTDGYVTRRAIGRLLDGGDMTPLEALLRVGLVNEDRGGYYHLPEFLNGANFSRAEREAMHSKKVAAGQKGGRARWNKERRNRSADEQVR